MAGSHKLSEYDALTLRHLAKNAKVISFDFFDTLYTRPIDDPEDVFDFLGLNFGIEDFRQLRRAAQTAAFRQMIKAGRKEITLKNIYDNFPQAGERRFDIEKAEFEFELALVEPNDTIVDFYNEMLAAGKHVVITSDMYFGEDFFKRALEKFGITQVPLYISADRNATKRDSGEIFDCIIEETGVAPGEILHIGDNHTADVQRPGEKGLVAWHYRPQYLEKRNKNQCLASSVINGLFRCYAEKEIAAETFDEMGFKYQAPATWGFLKWIELHAAFDGVTKLLFVSRDGYSLERMAQQFFKDRLPSFDYFLGSRIAFNLALMTEQNFSSHLSFLMSGSNGLSPGELLERIGIEPPRDDVMEQLGISPALIIAPDNYALIQRFLTGYRAEILKVCQKNRRGLFMYLCQLGVKPGDKIGLVDVGWSGTTQEAFEKTVKTIMDVEVVGYYFCLANTPEKKSREPHQTMKALINNETVSARVVDKIYENRMAVELFFSAPHDTIIGYEPVKDKVNAVSDIGRAKAKNHNEIISSLNHGLDVFNRIFVEFCERMGIQLTALQLSQPIIELVTDESWRTNPLFRQVENFDSWGSSRNQTMKFADYFKQ
ncbi:HAD family hydrolase [Erwinia sp. BNK-24-b]|uniref:HAD family hydrolase n=1 Tax=Erwinia TaxID=551 RepID=UPI001FEE0186|nr:HAD family hydrolase [Erwinia phyllosphaerae]MBV4365392.1 hypothetical protein [Erwinia phyllosphaerae]